MSDNTDTNPTMKTELTETELNAVMPHLQRVVETGEPWEDETLHFPAGLIIAAVLKLDGMTKRPRGADDDDFETNGWDWDWWQHFLHNGTGYTLHGSGFYGGLSFEREE